ncbi:AsnC family transcriptional regulator [Streptomyces sp. HSW2009]|uniref:Lrp/AsnC family transcriptional regulator n=1 Tax=Streptomyces sp. HSW2009 TaxID=3142890 RepID=UPI0032ECD501
MELLSTGSGGEGGPDGLRGPGAVSRGGAGVPAADVPAPGTSGAPGAPVSPGAPVFPGASADLGAAVVSAGPGAPGAFVALGGSVTPAASVAAGALAAPSTSSALAASDASATSGAPAASTTSESLAALASSATSATSATSVTSATSATSAMPATPATSATQVTLVTPDTTPGAVPNTTPNTAPTVVARAVDGRAEPTVPVSLSEGDRRLLAVLEVEGRAPLAELAAATGWSQSTVRRRVAELRRLGVLYFDVDHDRRVFGHGTRTALWVSVPPSDLHATGQQIAEHPEIACCFATTGQHNLFAMAICSDVNALYHYLTTRVASLAAIRQVETSPLIRRIKGPGPVPTHTPVRRR